MFSVLEQNQNYLKQALRYSSVPHLAVPTIKREPAVNPHFSVVYYDGEKQSVAHDCMIPEYALLEPKLLETLPSYQKKATLLDAICQCFESIWAVNSSDSSRDYARKAT